MSWDGGIKVAISKQRCRESPYQNWEVQRSVKHGADPNIPANRRSSFYDGSTLQTACYAGHGAIVYLSLDKGADVNGRAGEYNTALQAASVGGNEAMVKSLLDKGADVNAQGSKYNLAIQENSEEKPLQNF
jgi:ankyrin repeat protein